MRKVVLIVTAAVATAAPAVALASSSSSQNSAEKQCRTEQTQMGATTFKSTFGTGKNKKNAFGQCVSHRTQQNKTDEGKSMTSAEKQCRAQQSDSTFATTHGGMTFDEFYGSNHNDKNAFGKCVSSTAKSMTKSTENTQVKAEVSAAKQCRSMQSTSATTFATKFGSKSNAFGKCVSQTAHQLEQQQTST